MNTDANPHRESLAPLVYCLWMPWGLVAGAAVGIAIARLNEIALPNWRGLTALVFPNALLGGMLGTVAGAIAVLLTRVVRLADFDVRTLHLGSILAAVAGYGVYAPSVERGLSASLRYGLRGAAIVVAAATLLLTYRMARRSGPANATASRKLGTVLAALVYASLLVVAGGFYMLRAGTSPSPSADDSPLVSAPRFPLLSPAITRAPDHGRVIVLGIDGLNPALLEPLMDSGEAPNFARLRREGVYTQLATQEPTLSPLIWTTVATGRPYTVHGITDFVVTRRPALNFTGDMRFPRAFSYTRDLADRLAPEERTLVGSGHRRVKALWNLASEAGMRIGVSGWWATWPAEPVNGFLISNQAFAEAVDERIEHCELTGYAPYATTSPDELAAELAPLQASLKTTDWQILAPYADLTEDDKAHFRDIVTKPSRGKFKNPLHLMTLVVLKDRFYGEAALRLAERERPDLLLAYLQAPDWFIHEVARFTSPTAVAEGASPEDLARYKDSMRRVTRSMDDWIGRFLALMDDRTTLIVMSDHGFEREVDAKGRVEYAHHHAPPGVFFAYGYGVQPGAALPPGQAHIFNAAPTLIHLAGLPISREVEGTVMTGALDPAWLAEHPVRYVPTYEAGSPIGSIGSDGARNPEAIENLKALGYIE